MHLITRPIFAAYWLVVFLVCAFSALAVVAVIPGISRRRRVARFGARAIFKLTGAGPTLRRAENLPAESCIIVANHASYLDGILLTAALPPKFAFVIKKEMATVPFAGYFLQRIGSHFVDRTSTGKSSASAREILRSAKLNVSLGIFPEGTFQRAAGLQPFRPGAFRIAARAGLPVVPTVITGSRHILPDGSLLPRPGRLTVTLCEPIPTTDADQLAAAARTAILAELPEPDLAPVPEPDGE